MRKSFFKRAVAVLLLFAVLLSTTGCTANQKEPISTTALLFDTVISIEIYGSNDCKHWCKLPSVGGKPWKYFTFKYTLQNFKAADAFAGSIVEVQSRREDKMR